MHMDEGSAMDGIVVLVGGAINVVQRYEASAIDEQ